MNVPIADPAMATPAVAPAPSWRNSLLEILVLVISVLLSLGWLPHFSKKLGRLSPQLLREEVECLFAGLGLLCSAVHSQTGARPLSLCRMSSLLANLASSPPFPKMKPADLFM